MTITRYRKLPVEVDTIQWTGDNEAQVQAFTGGASNFYALDNAGRENSDDPEATATVYDKLHSTWVLVYTGQHIVRGVKGEYYPIAEDVLAETYERVSGAPEAAELETTARALSGLHRSAEDTVTRVITLHEQWVKAGPPPLGASLARWWDARLAELHKAIVPPTEQGAPIDWQAIAEQRERELKAVGEARHKAERERDAAYGERAHLVALLAAMTDGAVIAPAVDVEEPGWQIVYLTIGGRQASWHISPRDASLFDDVEHVSADDPRAHWDGHSTEDKYARIRQHTRLLARRCGPACAEAHTYTGRCEGAHPQQADRPCPQHPHAPTFDGVCGGCTQYPSDMKPAAPGGEEHRDVQH
ncbi:hypothetical protein AB0E99_22745 [Streptomyces sp. NPDC030592]|uniref:hypothetical protein n=1 Tax=Streptomyces sp. NPDC030592 TaxID=3155365 RepID=UPI0033DBDCC8